METRWTRNLVLLLSALANVFGQQGTGSLTGTVVDQNNAIMPSVSVKLTHVETNTTRTEVTSPSGEFRFDALIPGDYKLEATGRGFKGLVVDHIVLQSSETRPVASGIWRCNWVPSQSPYR
jgi:hypothetical protein